MDDDTRDELLAHAERAEVSSSKLVNRYVKEGLRMDKHPAIAFVTTSQGRQAVLAVRPGLQVIDVIGTWQGEGQDIAATARYFRLSEDEIQAVLHYYADYQDEVDQDLRDHLAAQQNFKRVLDEREARTRRRVVNA